MGTKLSHIVVTSFRLPNEYVVWEEQLAAARDHQKRPMDKIVATQEWLLNALLFVYREDAGAAERANSVRHDFAYLRALMFVAYYSKTSLQCL